MRRFVVAFLILMLSTGAPIHAQEPAAVDAPLSSAFTYQGRLTKAGDAVTASCAMTFGLWNAASGGAQLGSAQAVANVPVTDGLFTVTLNGAGQFGGNAFDGQARFLETSVQCPGDAAATVLPRQQITASPYALTALHAVSADSATHAVNATNALNATNAANATGLQGNPVGSNAPTAGQLLTWDGAAWQPAAAPAADWNTLANIPAGFDDNVDDEGWTLDGNADATAASRLGTTSGVTMTFIYSGATALRLAGGPPVSGSEFQPNIVGGSSANVIGPNVQGSVIGGGGAIPSQANRIFDSYGFIGSGTNNTIGISDGSVNNQTSSFIGGGNGNDVTTNFAAVVGGRENSVAATHGMVGGGQLNEVQTGGDYGVIPGGLAAAVTQYGQLAHSSGLFRVVGDSQASQYVLRNVTNSTTLRHLFLDYNFFFQQQSRHRHALHQRRPPCHRRWALDGIGDQSCCARQNWQRHDDGQ